LNLTNSKIILFSSIISFFILISVLPLPWNDSVNHSLIDLQFKLRGSRQISDDLVVVYIGDEDLKTLGSWPISRDYYSYAIHILKSNGAKVIALDVLLAQKDKYHPEYDQTFVDFVKNAGNVCLPMAFSELVISDSLYHGIHATYPFDELKQNATGTGFSNFSKIENIRKIPIFADYENKTILSFGNQIARLFTNDNYSERNFKNGCLRLNHFGSIENVSNIGFLDLLKVFKDNPDSLNFVIEENHILNQIK